MARKELMNSPNGVFALNETPIGRGESNQKRSDVQLIQFFLHEFFKKNPELFALLPKTKSGGSVIKIDGKYGKQTEGGILLFQKHTKKLGSKIKDDGVVNVATGVRSVNGNQFTIIFLNLFFKTLGDGKEHHGKLENHPTVFAFAPELAGELFVSLVKDEFEG
jgi:hypothetical protein